MLAAAGMPGVFHRPGGLYCRNAAEEPLPGTVRTVHDRRATGHHAPRHLWPSGGKSCRAALSRLDTLRDVATLHRRGMQGGGFGLAVYAFCMLFMQSNQLKASAKCNDTETSARHKKGRIPKEYGFFIGF